MKLKLKEVDEFSWDHTAWIRQFLIPTLSDSKANGFILFTVGVYYIQVSRFFQFQLAESLCCLMWSLTELLCCQITATSCKLLNLSLSFFICETGLAVLTPEDFGINSEPVLTIEKTVWHISGVPKWRLPSLSLLLSIFIRKPLITFHSSKIATSVRWKSKAKWSPKFFLPLMFCDSVWKC